MISKDHIISEIQRTAKENANKPLGTQSFENQTGIKKSDWYGKYWVKWGDALLEAGYEPNEFQKSYSNEFICIKYAELIKELGHIPVGGEIRMKGKTDKSFPSHTAFGRIGTKDQIIQKVLSFLRTQEGWDEVIRLCEEYEPKSQLGAAQENDSANYQDGYVYLIKSGKYYKIGMTTDIHRRSREISIELPERSETIHVIHTDDPSGIEAYWHSRFSSKRTNGEWFSLSSSDIKAFRRRKFM